MSQAEAHSWWADVEHLREAAERRQAADARQRARERRPHGPDAPADAASARARARAAVRVQDASAGRVDDLSARRAVVLDERAPRPRRPVPIWLADDAFGDPVAAARARAAAPRRTVEIRGSIASGVAARPLVETRPARRPERHERPHTTLGALIVARPDRIAFWAFALGLALAIAAAATPH